MRRDRLGFDEDRKENPRWKANWLSVLTFWYTLKIFQMGKQADITEDDLMKPLPEHQSSILGDKMAKKWSTEVERAEMDNEFPNLTKVIFKCFYGEFLLYGFVFFFMEVVVRINQPLFVGLLIRYFNPKNQFNTLPRKDPVYFQRLLYYWTEGQSAISPDEAICFATGIFLCSAIVTLAFHPNLMGIMHVGMKMRVACCSLIYRKVLRIKLTALGDQTVGNVINLMSNDVNRFDMAPMFFHYLWISPLQALLILYFMQKDIQISAYVGMLAIAVFIPFQVWLGRKTSVLRYKTATRTDNRVREMNEIIRGIKVIKMYAWEYPLSKKIFTSRQNEIKVIKLNSFIRGIIMSFIMFTTRFAIFLSVLSYVLASKKISAETVFVISSYYQILRQTMTVYFPQGIAQVAEAVVAINRIREFLIMPEAEVGDPTPLDPNWRKRENSHRYNKKVLDAMARRMSLPARIVIENASATYADEACLENLDLVVIPGQLTALIGQVGSGKTCVLNLMLGELIPFQGYAEAFGPISYAAQEPWLFAGTVRQNILFGQKYDRARYREVVTVCALARDFTLLPYGDRTIVGERGILLSGGQRARVNLARAVYRKADIYLLDDPLSAVDTHVGQHLFDECIVKYLGDKVVVLVTHQLQHLKQVQQIVIMDEGKIVMKGSYTTLQKSGLNFINHVRETSSSEETGGEANKAQNILRRISINSAMGLNVIEEQQEVTELRTYGAVSSKIYKQYFRAGGNWCCLLLLMLFFAVTQVCASATDFYLAYWVKLREQHNSTEPFHGRASTEEFQIIYSILIGSTAFFALSRSAFFFTIAMRASVNLHNKMFHSITRATMRFFNTNQSGRILNRFSKDLGAIDEFLPNVMLDTYQLTLNFIGVAVVVALVDVLFLIPTVFLCFCFIMLRSYYLKTSRTVKRLEGITKSPVFTHLNATLQGLITIRTHGSENLLTAEFDQYQDIHSSAWYSFICTSRAFGYWIDCLCVIFTAVVTFYFFILEGTFGSDVGLCITQCIKLTGVLQWGMRESAEMDNQMTSVERVLEFIEIEQEAPLESVPTLKPRPSWPENGEIIFRNAYLRYCKTEPPVLTNLNFTIKPKEKMGIVGRTGAGKSSLISTLFRLAYLEGEIIIDSVDIGQIGLHDLRRKISIIPQEPMLFSGTLRYNLDPFNEYSDAALVMALKVVEIKSALTEEEACLNQMVSEGGSNISVGHRQLICLGRAILRNNKVLVLDEATANVDAQTDQLIQTTIKTKFADCTVLTIAHRLNTIMDSDRVLVMDAGSVVELGHAHTLFKNKTGYFSGMVKRMGAEMEEQFKNIAKQDYEKKFGSEEPAAAAVAASSTKPKKGA